jgi:hypothetical protein
MFVAAVVLPAFLNACAGPGGDAAPVAGVAESPAPLRVPELPPEVALVGMGEGKVQSLFGQPSVQRSEQQAEYWRYSLGRCQLDLFLYPDPRTGQHQVTYFEVRPTGHQIAGRTSACADVAKKLDGRGRGGGDGLPPVESH